MKAREELTACLPAQEKQEALLADGEQRLVQLLHEEKNNPSLFRSPPIPPVVTDAKAELLRMQTVIDDLQRELVRWRGDPPVDPTAKDDDSMSLVAVSEPITACAKMLGLIDEAPGPPKVVPIRRFPRCRDQASLGVQGASAVHRNRFAELSGDDTVPVVAQELFAARVIENAPTTIEAANPGPHRRRRRRVYSDCSDPGRSTHHDLTLVDSSDDDTPICGDQIGSWSHSQLMLLRTPGWTVRA